ncbi:unnamed protein product [Symbiodinium natans]|uniref:J domain-containing protein n=1 Tax=Symbiodinium natans TaxID=878477 RepID=A0A812QUM9_9DINO|nr:unnamed protein product [Symbiodinium natans]
MSGGADVTEPESLAKELPDGKDLADEARKRQARNLAELEVLMRQAREQDEEDQFFETVRRRRQGDISPATVTKAAREAAAPHLDAAAASRFVRHHAQRSRQKSEEATEKDLPLSMERHYEVLGLRPGTPTEDVHAAYKRLGATLGDEPAFAAVGSLGSCLQSARGTMQAGARAKRLRAATAAYEAICEHCDERPWSRMPPPS